MTKKEKLIKKTAVELLEQNMALYLAEDNDMRMTAAQRAYTKLGLLMGLCGGDYFAPELCGIRAQQEELFGGWAVESLDSFFGCISDEQCKELAKQHKEEMGMVAEIRYYEKGTEYVPVPEIVELRETVQVADRDELVELVKDIELPASAEYVHIYIVDNEEPSFAVTEEGIRDFDNNEWL